MTDFFNKDASLRFFNPIQSGNDQNKNQSQKDVTALGIQFMEDMYSPDGKPMDRATFTTGQCPTNCGGNDTSVDVDVDI